MTAEITVLSSMSEVSSLRNELAILLGGERVVSRFALDIIHAFERYQFDLRVGLKTKGRAARLKRMLKLCDDLRREIAEHKVWLFARTDVDISSVLGVEEIISGGADSPLEEFRRLLDEAMRIEPDYIGREYMHRRRRLWIWLTTIYEEAIQRKAATSKNKDGTISGDFVRYIFLLSKQSKSMGIITPDMIDQFVDWYRSDDSQLDREEVAEARMLANTIRSMR